MGCERASFVCAVQTFHHFLSEVDVYVTNIPFLKCFFIQIISKLKFQVYLSRIGYCIGKICGKVFLVIVVAIIFEKFAYPCTLTFHLCHIKWVTRFNVCPFAVCLYYAVRLFREILVFQCVYSPQMSHVNSVGNLRLFRICRHESLITNPAIKIPSLAKGVLSNCNS